MNPSSSKAPTKCLPWTNSCLGNRFVLRLSYSAHHQQVQIKSNGVAVPTGCWSDPRGWSHYTLNSHFNFSFYTRHHMLLNNACRVNPLQNWVAHFQHLKHWSSGGSFWPDMSHTVSLLFRSVWLGQTSMMRGWAQQKPMQSVCVSLASFSNVRLLMIAFIVVDPAVQLSWARSYWEPQLIEVVEEHIITLVRLSDQQQFNFELMISHEDAWKVNQKWFNNYRVSCCTTSATTTHARLTPVWTSWYRHHATSHYQCPNSRARIWGLHHG